VSRRLLTARWECAPAAPGSTAALPASAWRPASVPGTVASVLREDGDWSLSSRRDFDAEDWWYRGRFSSPAPAPGHRVFLEFAGLATVADVWLNGHHLLSSTSMFVAHDVDVSRHLERDNELLIRFASLDAVLQTKRPRPRWKTRLVRHQGLRWIRTALLGRAPGWSPPVAAVGPWRPVWIDDRVGGTVEALHVNARLVGGGGVVSVLARLAPFGGQTVDEAAVTVGDHTAQLQTHPGPGGRVELRAEVRFDSVEPWWPHTHGVPRLYPIRATAHVAGEELLLGSGAIGFRTLAASTDHGGFELRVNDVPLFARGACWTTTDVVTLTGSRDAYRSALESARAAGMNLLRVSGAMFYEADDFYDLCDELGILVWQDFMFASMDYPSDDPSFTAEVCREANQLLDRLAARPSLAVLCGNSEVEQQATMLGLPASRGRHRLFEEVLAALCRARAPGIPYVASTPSGGVLPFHVDTGICHYYGVGAYRRGPDDVRRSGVRFASECLAFANVPDDRMIHQVLGPLPASIHQDVWKARVPRDAGASWDFEDVRDHYAQQLFRIDPRTLQQHDPARYLALGRVVTGELMASTFAEWRRVGSTCRGGLVWFFRDLWPGAGWGVIDSDGRPKAAYYYLKRALAPVALFLLDEGLNGLVVHAVNDTGDALDTELRFTAWRDGDVQVLSATTPLPLPARQAVAHSVDGMLGRFADTTYAYRFGPPSHEVSVAELVERTSGRRLASAFHFPVGLPNEIEPDVGLQAVAEWRATGPRVTVRARRFTQSVVLDVPGFQCADNYFHLAPGMEMTVALAARSRPDRPGGQVRALNSATPVELDLTSLVPEAETVS
jgi:beta-mannosidase